MKFENKIEKWPKYRDKKERKKKVFLPKINYMHACAKKKQLHIRGGCMHVNFFWATYEQSSLYADS